MSTVAADDLVHGRAALARGDWPAARESFEAAIAAAPTADAYEGLGWVGWWTADADLTISAREQAFAAFGAEGRWAEAAELAGWLAADLVEFRGESARAGAWLAQAARALDGLQEGPAHGWVAVHEAFFAHVVEADSVRALERAQVGRRIGRAHGICDLEAIGLAHAGLARIAGGDVQAGLRDLDAAVGLSSGSDLGHPVTPGWTLCLMLSACARLGDVARADQWCGALRAFADRWGNRHLMGSCRTSYGCVMTTSGSWDAAESELTQAIEDLSRSRAPMAAAGIASLGTLRLRQGRLDEARDLFEQAQPEPEAIVGLGALALAAGDHRTARDAAERALRRIPLASALDRLSGLELLVRAAAHGGDLGAARAARGEIDRLAASAGTPYISGRAQLAAAELALAEDAVEDGRRCAEDAIDAFAAAGAPYEAASARELLARALEGLGRHDHAQVEAQAAREAFVLLGVTRPRPSAAGELSARELEVLRLVAHGLSDAEVAERLVVSPHTVHRHVANVRAKLRLPSRAAAVAYAAREGLL